jgi:hypothetical protein
MVTQLVGGIYRKVGLALLFPIEESSSSVIQVLFMLYMNVATRLECIASPSCFFLKRSYFAIFMVLLWAGDLVGVVVVLDDDDPM